MLTRLILILCLALQPLAVIAPGACGGCVGLLLAAGADACCEPPPAPPAPLALPSHECGACCPCCCTCGDSCPCSLEAPAGDRPLPVEPASSPSSPIWRALLPAGARIVPLRAETGAPARGAAARSSRAPVPVGVSVQSVLCIWQT